MLFNFFNEAIDVNPNLIGPYINIGVSYEKIDKISESIKYLKKALKINSDLENCSF